MAYSVIETSNYDGEPIYLYEFRLNNKYWRYTSAASRISMGGSIWTPMGVADDGIKQTGETQVDALSITLPIESEVVGLFIGTPPINQVTVTIRHCHYGDNEAAVCYVGEVGQINESTPTHAVVTCNTISASLERNGLRLSWSRGCPYSLYDSCCKVNKEAFRFDGAIASVGGSSIVVPGAAAFGDGYFTGGYIEWIDPTRGTERRAIETHGGDQLIIFGVVGGLSGGMVLKIYPGCGRTVSECQKFNNLDNYGGVPSMPGQSPFDGSPVF